MDDTEAALEQLERDLAEGLARLHRDAFDPSPPP
jgi:hypothetical protein